MWPFADFPFTTLIYMTISTKVIRLLAGLLVAQTVVAVLLNFPDYFPPNFRSDFLLGRGEYFHGAYAWAFYAHIVSGLVTLVLGMVLMSSRFRVRWPAWHRAFGRVQVMCVLLLLAPSGFGMAWYATGMVAGVGFATLAVATATTAAMGWRRAVSRRFAEHRVWMQRCFVLLCSAVVIRVIGGASDVFGIAGVYPYAAWLSWLAPLVVLEAARVSPPVRRPQRLSA